MRPIVIGLLLAAMAAIAAPTIALASTPAAPIDPAAKQKGMAAAPAIISGNGMDCQLADARFIGTSTDPKTKVASNFYELACKDNEGFIVGVPGPSKTPPGAPAPTAQIYTCLEVAAQPGAGIACILPENANPKAGLQALVAKDRPDCAYKDVRAIGQASDHSETVFEVACQDGAGYVIDTSWPVSASKPAKFVPCVVELEGSTKCTLTDEAADATYFNGMVGKIGKPCTATGHRVVGGTADGDFYFEVACKEGKGYIFPLKANGAVGDGIDCAVADNVGGGCTLTNARQAQTEQADLYSKLAHKAGFACDVAKYSPFEVNMPGHEVVELSCSNRPDGAVAIFPASSSEAATIYDCAHSELAGFRCSFSKPEASYSTLTADLNKVGKSSCTVSGSRIVGETAEGQGFIEVACSDGAPGFVITYNLKPTIAPTQAVGCALAKGIAGGCQMPENNKHG